MWFVSRDDTQICAPTNRGAHKLKWKSFFKGCVKLINYCGTTYHVALRAFWIKFPNVLSNNAKMINLRLKFQAWCQIDFSRALKWGIVHLFNLNSFRDMIKNKICNFFEFSHFFTKIQDLKNSISIKLVVSLKVLEL